MNDLPQKTIFVTGGTGMLGSHLLWQFLQHGYTVHALKRPTADLSLVKRIFGYHNATDLLSQIFWFDGDLLQPATLERAMSGCQFVAHAAALVSFQPEDKDKLLKINVEGTRNVMQTALNLSIEKVVHVSSIASFGRAGKSGFVDETCSWSDDSECSVYSRSKYEGEQVVWDFSRRGLPVVIVNPSVIIGAGDWHKGSAELLTTVYRGLRFYTRGCNGYVDVRDVAEVMRRLLESDIVGERFIVNGCNWNYQTLFTVIANALDKKPPQICVGHSLAGIAWRVAKILAFFTHRPPIITRETARTAMKQYAYSNQKLVDALHYSFIDPERMIEETARRLKEDMEEKSRIEKE